MLWSKFKMDPLLCCAIFCSYIHLTVVAEGNKSDSAYLDVVSQEKRLITALLEKYQKIGTFGRPVKNASTALQVSFGLGLIKMDIEERDNIVSISAWTQYKWRDEYLVWNPVDYGNISMVRLPQYHIWTPDIMLYNTASTERLEREALVVVTSNGTVLWYPHKIFHCSCSIDVRNFPFDNQTCHLWFGSWTYSARELDLEHAFTTGIDLSTFLADFRESSQWNIVDVHSSKLPGDFAVLTFTLFLARRMIFSSYILTFPVVFLSFLTLLVFWLPAGHSDKTNLGLTIFGNLLLLLLILVEAAPPTASGVPLLGVYYCFNIVIVILSIFLSSLVIKIGHGDGKKRVPTMIRKIFFNKTLVKCLCGLSATPPDASKTLDALPSKIHRTETSSETDISTPLPISVKRGRNLPELFLNQEQLLMSICDNIDHYLTSLRESEVKQLEHGAVRKEWFFLAKLLDRFFLLGFLVAIVISVAAFFPR